MKRLTVIWGHPMGPFGVLVAVVGIAILVGLVSFARSGSGASPAAPGTRKQAVGPATFHLKSSPRRLVVNVPAGLPASTLSADEIQGMLTAHNTLRARYNQPPLTWNNDLASLAQDWANQMAASGNFDHRPNNAYGENLFVQGFTGDASGTTPQNVVDSWASEVQFFDATTNTCPDYNQCGHFTQEVWGTTTTVGCAKAVGNNNGWGDTFKAEYWVCNYDPAGNLTNGTDNSVKPFG